MRTRLTPLTLFRAVAVAEAVTWALLLVGMFLKYVTETTDRAVSVFGMVHGVVFLAYALTTLLVAVDQRWSPGRTLLGLLSAVPPFMTVWFDRYAERRGALAAHWRLTAAAPGTAAPGAGGTRLDRPVAWLLRNPLRGALAGLVAVLALTGVALVAGPPVG
jgi:integral membrane protein